MARSAIWFHTIRRRQSAYPGGRQPPGFATYVDKLWHDKHHSKDSYINELYITIVRKADTKGAAKIHHFLKKASQAGNKDSQAEAMREMHKELAETINRLVATAEDYGARVLTTYENEHGVFSEPLEFLARLVNCGFTQPIRYTPADISHTLPMYRLYLPATAESKSPARPKNAWPASSASRNMRPPPPPVCSTDFCNCHLNSSSRSLSLSTTVR